MNRQLFFNPFPPPVSFLSKPFMADQLLFRARCAYRAILRELPRRPLSSPSPLQTRIRQVFGLVTKTPPSTAETRQQTALARVQEAEQFAQYARAQRMYATLLERYNPGAGMDEGERVRLTARMVGMDLPIETQER